MARGLDHIVLAVHDLDAAAALYRGLVSRSARATGIRGARDTQNHIVQFPGTFIELLAIADGSGIAPHAPRQFSFGAFSNT